MLSDVDLAFAKASTCSPRVARPLYFEVSSNSGVLALMRLEKLLVLVSGLQVKQVELQMRVAEMLPCAVLGPLALEGLEPWLSDADYASAAALEHVFSSASLEHIGL